MARIGYARASSSDQNLEIQKERLKAAGCEVIRSETGSGSSRDGRGELETIIQFLHAALLQKSTDFSMRQLSTLFW
ncbi:recombinase family protein [Labrenzia sp. THAF82]|uniref:recombinase family protein n=1 Tax=Labrenzia sp. THAF82 TaxID=2587861 RepID=UPI0027398E9F|nr:recombinase family protein [Labrenzia sp. THAF82]